MRQSIQNRIQEIDKFFELNFDKPYVFNFENGRIKLKKLLMYEPEIITEIADNNNNNNNNKCVVFGIEEDLIKNEKDEIDNKGDNIFMDKNKIMNNMYDNDISNEKKHKKRINEFKSKILNLTERKNLNCFNKNVKVNNNNYNYNNDKIKNMNYRNNALNIPNIPYSAQSSNYNKTNKPAYHELNNKKYINSKNSNPDKIQFSKNKLNNNNKINSDYKNDNPNKNELKKNNDKNSYLSKYINSKQNLKINNKSKLNNKISNEIDNDNDNDITIKNNNKINNNIFDNHNEYLDDEEDYLQKEILKINKRPENLEMKKKYYRNPFYDSLKQNNMQLKEIKLKFVLTKEEYTLLMREKARFNNPLNS